MWHHAQLLDCGKESCGKSQGQVPIPRIRRLSPGRAVVAPTKTSLRHLGMTGVWIAQMRRSHSTLVENERAPPAPPSCCL